VECTEEEMEEEEEEEIMGGMQEMQEMEEMEETAVMVVMAVDGARFYQVLRGVSWKVLRGRLGLCSENLYSICAGRSDGSGLFPIVTTFNKCS
jgi:hypothetical protein